MTSLTALLSFILLFITIIVLYVVPQGRVAYWADWRLWGLTKTQWGNIHINIGLLFLLSIFLHIYYNWKALLNYLKNRAKNLKILTREFNAAMVLLCLFGVGTYFEVAPFAWVLQLNAHFKDQAAARYGEPPYGHAELSTLKAFAAKTNIDLTDGMARLKQANIVVDDENQTLKDIARINKMSPQQVFTAMTPIKESVQIKSLPPAPPPGTGNKKLDDLSREYNFDLQQVLKGLTEVDVKVEAGMTIKQIALQNEMAPDAVYALVRKVAHRQTD
jgi:DNA-binding CsgD family transcriptional regulator